MNRPSESDLLKLLEEMKIRYENLSTAKRQIEGGVIEKLMLEINKLLKIIDYLEKSKGGDTEEKSQRVKELEEQNEELKAQLSQLSTNMNLVKAQKDYEELEELYNEVVEENEQLTNEKDEIESELKELKEKWVEINEKQENVEELKRMVITSSNNYLEEHQLLIDLQKKTMETNSEEAKKIQKRTELLIQNQNERNNVFFKWSCLTLNEMNEKKILERNGVDQSLNIKSIPESDGWLINFEYLSCLGEVIAIYKSTQDNIFIRRPYLCALYRDDTSLWISEKGDYIAVTFNEMNEITSYSIFSIKN